MHSPKCDDNPISHICAHAYGTCKYYLIINELQTKAKNK